MRNVHDANRRAAVMTEVMTELDRQDSKWGEQNHSMHYWNTIITEEFGESAEAAFEVDTLGNYAAAKHYTTELVHVAACAIQAAETLRRMHPEWDPQIEWTEIPKGVAPRGEIKGQIRPESPDSILRDQQRKAGK